MMQSCRRVCIALLALALVACGGGQMEARIGGGGTGAPLSVGMGSIDGFGSVIVNGIHYDERDATILRDDRPDQPTAISVAALRLGMQIAIEHRDFVISKATVAAEVIGPVTSISASSVTVMGQTVRVNADSARPTVFDGFAQLGDLAAGAVVEVHGQRADDDAILATRIELRPMTSMLRVAGTVANLSSAGFTIGNLTVLTAQAAIVPANQALANGARVAVWTDLPLNGSQLVARVVRLGAFVVPTNAAMIVDGIVASVPAQGRFTIGEFTVDLTGAQITGGNLGSLTLGRAVRVHGTMLADILRATRIEIISEKPVQITGPVTDFADAAETFKVRSTVVRVTPQTTYVGGTASNLGAGVIVKLEGKLANGVVEVQTLEFVAPAAGGQRVLFGVIAAPVSVAPDGSRTFRLEGTTNQVETTPATEYRRGTAADLAAGRSVRLRVELLANRLVAHEVQFMDGASDIALEFEGIANRVSADSFAIDSRVITLTATTVFLRDGEPGSRTDLVNGAKVDVQVVRVGDTLVAQVVDISPRGTGTVKLRGIVSDRSPADAVEFRVGGQRVSVAGNPQVTPGNRSVADIRNGQDLEVTGTLANGLLTATRIRFR
jgi:hypothetical protein